MNYCTKGKNTIWFRINKFISFSIINLCLIFIWVKKVEIIRETRALYSLLKGHSTSVLKNKNISFRSILRNKEILVGRGSEI